MNLEARFWMSVLPKEGCWGWRGTFDKGGYARIGLERGYRVAYSLFYGAVPKGLEVDHQCRNRGCVRPDHLKAVTRKFNRENLKGAHKNNLSGVRGVHFHRATGKWRARVGHLGKVIYLGLFDTVEGAALAAKNKRLELFKNNLADREDV